MNKSCYLIMAGGTGGHVFPALAVAKALKERGAQVHWLGTQAGMESTIVPQASILLHRVDVKGFRGKGLLAKIAAPFLLCRAVFQAIKVIRHINPTVVIGFGGFVAAPGGIAAKLLGKKLIVHEQNSVAGSTNRLLAPLANQRLEAFPNSLKNARHVGNPVRSMLAELKRDFQTQRQLRVLVMGGSLGAKAINDLVPEAMSHIDPQSRPDIWHQTGKSKLAPVQQAYSKHGIDARVEEFIDDVAQAYEWADVLICRAGALTVSEVAVAGVPAIFVPLPSAIDNHQFFNAKWLADQGAALLVEQKNLTVDVLSEMIIEFVTHRERLVLMAKKVKQLALPSATDKVVEVCETLSAEVDHAL